MRLAMNSSFEANSQARGAIKRAYSGVACESEIKKDR